MTVMLRVIAAFAVVTIGAGLGAEMHRKVQEHDASLRTPGSYAEHVLKQKFQRCQLSTDPDRCALMMGITI